MQCWGAAETKRVEGVKCWGTAETKRLESGGVLLKLREWRV